MSDTDDRAKERLVVRQYRQMLNDVDEAEGALVNEASGSELIGRLDEVDQLYKRVSLGPTVAELDSTLLARLADIQRRRVRGFNTSLVTFRPLDFADRLAATVGEVAAPTAAAWAGLGRLTAPLLAPAPGLRVLLGTLPPLDAPPPERKPRAQRAKPNPLAAAVSPDQVTEVAQPEATRHQVNRLYGVLRELHRRSGRPIGFYEFAYHPDDFGTTVENVFHTAILVRERLARVRLDGDGLPVIEPVADGGPGSVPLSGTPAGDAARCHQVLLKVDHESWRFAVAEFGIRKPLIPAAAATATNGAQETPRRGRADAAAPPAKRRP